MYPDAVDVVQVGSIVFTAEVGDEYQKGDELGYFAFGGSTVIVLFGADALAIDGDLLHNRYVPLCIALLQCLLLACAPAG